MQDAVISELQLKAKINEFCSKIIRCNSHLADDNEMNITMLQYSLEYLICVLYLNVIHLFTW